MAHLALHIPHFPPKHTARNVRPAASAVGSRQDTKPVLITEQEVRFNTAAAALVRPATTHRRWSATTLIAAIGHIHIGLPEPQPCYPRREANYFEAARMSRHMEHL